MEDQIEMDPKWGKKKQLKMQAKEEKRQQREVMRENRIEKKKNFNYKIFSKKKLNVVKEKNVMKN